MAFPTTGILDAFTRANENPVSDGGNWGGPLFAGSGRAQLVGNAITTTGTFNENYRSNTNYGPDCEAYCTIATLGTDGAVNPFVEVTLRTSSEGAGWNGYQILFFPSLSEVVVVRTDNEVDTQLGASISQSISGGHKVGAEMVSSTITPYIDTGGGWTALSTRSDGTYTGAGHIGVSFGRSGTIAWVLDDFGGGTVVVSAVTWEQEGFRWRNDNGSETTATWLAAQDTQITQPTATNTRLRVLIDTTSGDPSAEQMRLEYRKKNSGQSWRNL